MKIRRGEAGLEVDQAGQWVPWSALPVAVREPLDWLTPLAPLTGDGRLFLPFAPRSFRDCMLFEQHWVQSSRGYARRFLPMAYRLARVVETLTGRPFPAFKPHSLARRQPIYYFGNHLTFVPSGAPMGTPPYARVLDYELELGLVLARPLLNATPEQALAAIGGFVVVNDWTARDVQRPEMQSGMGPQKSKHFVSSMSATMVTADEILPRIEALSGWVQLNGHTVSRTSTKGMLFGLGQVLAHLSHGEPLQAGELIATGTLPMGCGMENGHWVKPGDVLRIGIDGVGEIEHRIQ